jgi:hypothetical protein
MLDDGIERVTALLASLLMFDFLALVVVVVRNWQGNTDGPTSGVARLVVGHVSGGVANFCPEIACPKTLDSNGSYKAPTNEQPTRPRVVCSSEGGNK